jgi:hypothetical protein
MSKRYTDDERAQALERLDANRGDFHLTSAETGISVGTLRQWKRRSHKNAEQIVEESLKYLKYLQEQLIDNAVKLAESLEAATVDAPLNHRAAALGQLIDRIIKLAERIPQAVQREQVIRIEYRDPDGSIHSTPYWARGDSAPPGSFSSGRVRTSIRQDGNGQNSAD